MVASTSLPTSCSRNGVLERNWAQLSAGVGKEDGKSESKTTEATSGSLTPEDLKELEDLDLSELDKKS